MLTLLKPKIARPSELSELKVIRRPSGRISLTDSFSRMRDYRAAVIKTPELDSFARRFNYEAHGYDALLPGPGMLERGPIVDFKNGKPGAIKQANYVIGEDQLKITELEPDLYAYRDIWTLQFTELGNIVSPVFNGNFEMRLKVLCYDSEWAHYDEDVVAIIPAGEGRASTVLIGEEKSEIVERPINGEMTITTPGFWHSSPVSKIPRAGFAITKYSRELG